MLESRRSVPITTPALLPAMRTTTVFPSACRSCNCAEKLPRFDPSGSNSWHPDCKQKVNRNDSVRLMCATSAQSRCAQARFAAESTAMAAVLGRSQMLNLPATHSKRNIREKVRLCLLPDREYDYSFVSSKSLPDKHVTRQTHGHVPIRKWVAFFVDEIDDARRSSHYSGVGRLSGETLMVRIPEEGYIEPTMER